MSRPQLPKPAKLVIGLIMQEKHLIVPAADALIERFGPVDMVSSWFPFDFTAYYEPEMGAALFRRVLAFKVLIKQRVLAQIKLATNDLEQAYLAGGKRRVNIDPGYMLHERFVLATGKNYSHRIYIGRRIYADLTLIYKKGRFQTLPWTYPDYAEKRMLAYLHQVRQKYVLDLREACNG
ncbi:MAG: DUF4416 family protein [Pseudomonadota bacterium]